MNIASHRLVALAAVAGSILLAACQSHPAGSHDAGHAAAHWTYSGKEGPSCWGELSPEYALCAGGKCQSPIDVVRPQTRDLENPVFDYHPSAINILNNGHTVQVNYDAGSSVAIDGKQYALVQFHLHAPSEHHVGGVAYPAELHLVHKAADGSLAVVGVLITQGRENPGFAAVMSQLPPSAGPAQLGAGQVDAGAMLPLSLTSYRYGGSLTTPPCSENVNWTLLTTPVELSEGQIKAFTRLYSGNNRPIQPLNARTVVEDTTP